MRKRHSPLLIVCPVRDDDYAGWLFQMRSYAERCRADVRFVFDETSGRGGAMARSLRFARHALGRVRREEEQSIVLFPVFFLSNMLVALFLRHTPYAVRISGGELNPGNPWIFRLRIALLRRARCVIVLNTDAADRLAEYGVQNIELVPNAVSEHFRPPTDEERRQAKRRLGLSSDAIVVGNVGTLCQRKRQELLVSAAARSATQTVEVLLCGPYSGHPEADMDYYALCRGLAKASGVRLVATGRHKDMLQAYWAMDIFAFPSLREGMPNALLEAMACGLPCVASDIPGCRDIIDDGISGYLVPALAPEIFTSRIVELASDREERQRLSYRAQIRVTTDFSSEAMDKAYTDLLRLEVDA